MKMVPFRHATAPERAFAFAVVLIPMLGTGTHAFVKCAAALKIGLVPKPNSVGNDFFGPIEEGCKARAKELTNKGEIDVECIYGGAESKNTFEQRLVIQDMVESFDVDGIAISVSDVEEATQIINHIVDSTNGTVPVITYDSDAKESLRQAFIATDNFAFGVELGKVLNQLNPEGGKYGMIAALAPNLQDRVNGVRHRLKKTKWTEVSHSPTDCDDRSMLAIEQMYQFAEDPDIKAIVPLGGWPMFLEDEWIKFVETYPDLTIVCGDSLDTQLRLMNQGHVNGLVGQLPFLMGQIAVDTLIDLLDGKELDDVIKGTAVLEVLRSPLNLPALTVDMHQIKGLSIMGYVYALVIVLTSTGFVVWVLVNAKERVVAASQPFFLLMICVGIMIMALGIIPLSIDDGYFSNDAADAACMSFDWLFTIGFTTAFSALFSKTWRVNQLFRNPHLCRRVTVTVKDVFWPFCCIMTINVITLICWTVIAPDKYVREDLPGTDDWNRIIASYGTCRSDSPVFGLILFFVNMGTLLVANFQAYQARSIQTEYAESGYISIIMFSILQSAILGMPIFFLTHENPRTHYVVVVNVIFLLCMVTLGFIFIPKVIHLRKELKELKENGGRLRRVAVGGIEWKRSNAWLPNLRKDYIQRLDQLLEPGGTIMLVALERVASAKNTPAATKGGIPEAMARKLFAGVSGNGDDNGNWNTGFTMELIEETDQLLKNPRDKERYPDLDRLLETVYRIQKGEDQTNFHGDQSTGSDDEDIDHGQQSGTTTRVNVTGNLVANDIGINVNINNGSSPPRE